MVIPLIQKSQKLFGNSDGKIVHFILLTSDFLNTRSLKNQFIIFKKSFPFTKRNHFDQLIDISLITYYDTLKYNKLYDLKNCLQQKNFLLSKNQNEFFDMAN